MYPLRTDGRSRDVVASLPVQKADSSVEPYSGFLSALFLLALLYSGDCRLARAQVVEATIQAVCDERVPIRSDPRSAWRRLAAYFDLPNDRAVLRDSIPAAVRTACLSGPQRETMALLGAGRNVAEVASLMGMTVADVDENRRRGNQALGDAVQRSGLPRVSTPLLSLSSTP